MKTTRTAKKLLAVFCVAAMSFAILCCLACSSSSYSLTKDDSIATEWGTLFQYKVDPNWTSGMESSDEHSANSSYYNESGDGYVAIYIDNTDDSLYKFSSTKTYSDWEASQEDFYSRSAAEEAEWYRENMSGDYYDAEFASADSYADHLNYSMTDMGTISVAGIDFRLFKMAYTVSYSDAAYAKLQSKIDESNTGEAIQQVSDHEAYYAVLKDGIHDVEISADSENLLRDFVDTLEVSW